LQIVLRPAVNTTFTVDIGSIGAGLEVRWEQVGFVYVSEILNNTQGSAGWWPDPCLRVPRAIAVGGVATSFWFTVRAPPDTPAGVYKTTVTLSPVGGVEGTSSVGDNSVDGTRVGAAVSVPVSITVFGFSLPTKPALLTAFNLDAAKVKTISVACAARL
jgi:hypothetical protein